VKKKVIVKCKACDHEWGIGESVAGEFNSLISIACPQCKALYENISMHDVYVRDYFVAPRSADLGCGVLFKDGYFSFPKEFGTEMIDTSIMLNEIKHVCIEVSGRRYGLYSSKIVLTDLSGREIMFMNSLLDGPRRYDTCERIIQILKEHDVPIITNGGINLKLMVILPLLVAIMIAGLFFFRP